MELQRAFQSVALSAIITRPSLLASQPTRCIAASALPRVFSTSLPRPSPPPFGGEAAASAPPESSAPPPPPREQRFSDRFTPSERLRGSLSRMRARSGEADLPPRPAPKINPWSTLGSAGFMGRSKPSTSSPTGSQSPTSTSSKSPADLNFIEPMLAAARQPRQPDINGEFAKFSLEDIRAKWGGAQRAEPRLRPSTGRTVNVSGNVDVARSFAILEAGARRNRLKADVNSQRFHERPGLKRKRLKSQRWIRRFRQGFQACCKRIDELQRQGW